MDATGAATPDGNAPRRPTFDHLNMVRGLAALAVCVGHVRSFLFVDYGSRPPGHEYELPLYLLSALGGQAVMMFFALSGFLVGGPALGRISRGRWPFGRYAVHRFTRLWTVLIPALLAGALLDGVGRDVLHLAGYSGEYMALAQSVQPGQHMIDLSLRTLLGNVAFMANILVPVYGTNGPLWSLTYEFAYYFAVPLAWFALSRGGAIRWRLIAATVALAMLFVYPPTVWLMGTIWVAGALANLLLPRVMALARRPFLVLTGAAFLVVVATLPLTVLLGNKGNVAFGLACAAALPCLARLPSPGPRYSRLAFWLSEISFTLYVVHFPFVALCWFGLLAPYQFEPGPAGLLAMFGLLAAVIGYAAGMWWLFERNTPRVRGWAERVAGIRDR